MGKLESTVPIMSRDGHRSLYPSIKEELQHPVVGFLS